MKRVLAIATAVIALATIQLAAEDPTGESITDATKPAVDQEVAKAQKLMREFLMSRKSGDLLKNRDQVLERAEKVSQQFRKAYPFQSLRNRLSYEKKNTSTTAVPKLSVEAAQRLDLKEKRYIRLSIPGTAGEFRSKSLERLHAEKVVEFVASEGFGFARIPSPPSPLYWELPPAPTVPLAIAPKNSIADPGEKIHQLPRQVDRYDMLRLHAGKPDWTDKQIEDKYYNKVQYDVRMQAMFEAYTGWKAKHNPLNLPSRKLILDSHDAVVLNFAGSGRNGYVKDLDHVVGFGSHAVTAMPRFEPGPIELRYWPKTGKENPIQWLVTQLQLVSLLKHDMPKVYVSKNLPKMEELNKAKLRELNQFESANLERLYDGEHVEMDVRETRIRMLGAIRASKQCLQCHQVERGTLLGAFSYELTRAKRDSQEQISQVN